MSNYRNEATAFVIALSLVATAVLLLTLEPVDTRLAGGDAPPGAIGLARPHLPLYPSEPAQN